MWTHAYVDTLPLGPRVPVFVCEKERCERQRDFGLAPLWVQEYDNEKYFTNALPLLVRPNRVVNFVADSEIWGRSRDVPGSESGACTR